MLTWIFYLDNTLHNASPHIFPHINRGMTRYLQEHLALDKEAAARLRIHYWRTYGATLLGLIRHHGAIAAGVHRTRCAGRARGAGMVVLVRRRQGVLPVCLGVPRRLATRPAATHAAGRETVKAASP